MIRNLYNDLSPLSISLREAVPFHINYHLDDVLALFEQSLFVCQYKGILGAYFLSD